MNNVAILNARNFIRDGGKFGNYVATSYELQGDRIILSCSCDACGAKNKIPYSHVNIEARTPGTVRCVNIERHAPKAKAAEPDWTLMSSAEFKAYVKRMPADAFIKLCRSNPVFAARNEETPTTYVDTRQVIAGKDERDRAALVAKHSAQFENAYYAHEFHNLPQPFRGVEGWMALPEATRQAVIKQFDLNNVNWKDKELTSTLGSFYTGSKR